MRALFMVVGALLLGACATPRPVVDTAVIVAKMSSDMDTSLKSYVGSLNKVRKADAKRLQDLHNDGEKVGRAMRDEVQIMTLADDAAALKVMSGLTKVVVAEADPLRPAAITVSGITTGPAAFDGAPLKTVAQIAGDIAKPQGVTEQFKVLLSFAQTVNADLEKATTDNQNTKP
jgi:hypothetical protein